MILTRNLLAAGGLVLVIIVVGIFLLNKPTSRSLNAGTPPSTDVTQTPSGFKCPTGFILVPGNPLYQTKGFCVMKYDAKCAVSSDLTQGLEPVVGSQCTSEGTYKNNSSNCACTGSRQIVSVASGYPVTYIAETDNTPNNAKNYCLSQGWHLMNNAEWMTIARNVETMADNWCNKDGTGCGNQPGTVGKILANGHNDNSAQALVAASDDQPCWGTTSDDSNLCGHPSSQKRTLALSNHEIIWDLAGNVWQWVDVEVLRKDQPQSYTNGRLDRGWIWSEFTSGGGLATVITDNGRGPNLGYDSFRPLNPTWNSINGVGRIYHYSGILDNNTTADTFIRGGNWRHGYDSGAFTVHMSPQATKENIDDVGFRCAAELK
jgi:hypothetical protein